MKKLTFIYSLTLLLISGCFDFSHSNYPDSDGYNSKKKRIEILKNEITFFSPFDDTEFELFNVNGFSNSITLLPGASSWHYNFVIKINPSDIDKWITGIIKSESIICSKTYKTDPIIIRMDLFEESF